MVAGELGAVEGDLGGPAKRFIVKGFIEEQPLGTQGLQPPARQLFHGSGQEPAHPGHPLLVAAGLDLAQARGQQLFGLFPVGGAKLAPFITKERAAETVRIVKRLNGCLSANTKAPFPHRMVGIALGLDDAAFPSLGQHAASGRALTALGCIVGGHTGYDVVRRDQIRDQLFGL